ncbi:GyrI-like domain-containing protein [Paucisalibacillus sp. EB02]|uniref:GyrI-like domain-containing protein n=1 Tax=Paucisalibacillus sp. EB02 TaxID=1347087 RepID=UPI0004B133EA|nr:GyrI-like domain-containing protein [Paucisalibacillus sp. EB02]
MSETKELNNTIKELDELKLVGFRVLCPGDQYVVEIPKASSHLSERISEIKHVVNPLQQYGAFVVENETVDKDGYWVCVEVKEFEDIPPDMVTLTVPSQMYAVTRHKGENKKIMNSYDELHKWIHANNYTRLKEKWHLEKFYSWNDVENVDVELFDTISK